MVYFPFCSRLILLVSTLLLLSAPSFAQPFKDTPTTANPALATYVGGAIALQNMEDFVYSLPKLERVPRLVDGAMWRKHICRELVKQIMFTSQALSVNLHQDPALQRARNYFIQEWLSYAMLRDNVVNTLDISNERLREFYELHKTDWYLSPTVSMRLIRTRSKEKSDQALARLKAGENFEAVEKELSEASIKQRGKIIGPFPSTTTLTIIPPPEPVIEAAWTVDEGKTTGPLFLNDNYFIVQTVDKAPGEQKSFEELIELVDARVRQAEGDERTRNFIRSLREELGVVENDAGITDANTRPEDVIATIGKTLITKDEYITLNGRVRGPATVASQLEPTPLRRFIVPSIFAEAARQRGYTQRKEFFMALLFHDLRRFGQRMLDNETDRRTPRVTEAEIRQHYNIAKSQKDEHGHTLGTLEQSRDGIMDVLHQKKRGDTEKRLAEEAIEDAHFEMTTSTECALLTAFEAFIAVSDKVPPGYQIRMISTAGDDKDPVRQIPTPLMQAGRRSDWRLTFTKGTDTSEVLELHAPPLGKIYDGSTHFTSNPLFLAWNGLWRFDSDGLARLAVDSGISDFMAKYENNVYVNTRIEFDWKGKEANDCWIVFEMRPLGEGPDRQILTLRYSAKTGSMSRKPLFECLPCEQMKRIMNEPI